jgi:hypothetical protein
MGPNARLLATWARLVIEEPQEARPAKSSGARCRNADDQSSWFLHRFNEGVKACD